MIPVISFNKFPPECSFKTFSFPIEYVFHKQAKRKDTLTDLHLFMPNGALNDGIQFAVEAESFEDAKKVALDRIVELEK